MSRATEQSLAAPDLLKLTLYLLPEWLRIALGAAVLLLMAAYGVGRLRRAVAARRSPSARPAK
ncbi:hypothetical protein GCM10009730_24540 [Streptomyces albidochromogenes]|uniref:hypothetical protein n=1 Tax=Streptomyces albidochromogenes TaxID=329524 RepID=UPI00110FF512|nr:hypothetical protein [Streptomyces albidochromogenes]